MKTRLLAATTLLVLAAGLAWYLTSPSVGIPNRIERTIEPSGTPGWVSESVVRRGVLFSFQPKGLKLKLHPLLIEWELPIFEIDLEAGREALESCKPGPVPFYQGEQARDLDDLIEESTAISRVRVVGRKSGFRLGKPGQLLLVEVLEIYRDTGEVPIPRDELFLFHQYARMIMDGAVFCFGERPVPRGEYFLFQAQTHGYYPLAIPDFPMHNSALVAADGTYYGELLHHTVEKEELAADLDRQLRALRER